MAEPRAVEPLNFDYSDKEAHASSAYRRVGLLNGLLIGLALGLGAWGLAALRVSRLPVSLFVPELLLGIGLVTLLCGLVGWLTSRIAWTPVTLLLWTVAAVISMLIMGYLAFYGRTLVVWLADRRFWGRLVFPYTLGGSPGGLIIGGLLIFLVLFVLALLQNYRLENIASEVGRGGRLSRHAWVSLLLPLPLVFLASLATRNVMADPASPAVEVVHRAISRAQVYEGDLRQLDDGTGVSYAALRGVQEMLGGDYTLSIADVNPANSTVLITANFANGAWVYCRVINNQLSLCYDASTAYTVALRSLITGEPLPEVCRGCALNVTDEAVAWLAERRERLGSDLTIERLAQQGSHVLMRVNGGDNFAVECSVVGVAPPEVTECSEVVNGH